MRSVLALLAFSLFGPGCRPAAADDHAPPPRPRHWVAFNDQAALLPAIRVDSLTLVPIVATDAGLPAKDVDVVTLDEAFAKKLVSIKEQADETVNALTLTNRARRPMFLLAGEVILGGKQDRIIGANTVIPARSTQSVPVFCVEHGRWDGKSKEFRSARALAHGRLRGRASFANQSEVWREVAAKNALRRTSNATGTYRQVANQQANGTLAGSERKVRAALAKLAPGDRRRMVGYVVALGGKVATVDLFGSPKLFAKLEGKLLRSYLTGAVDVPAAARPKPPSVAEIKAFMADADKAAAERSYENATAATVHYKGAKAAKAKVELKNAAHPDRAPTVYQTYQSTE